LYPLDKVINKTLSKTQGEVKQKRVDNKERGSYLSISRQTSKELGLPVAVSYGLIQSLSKNKGYCFARNEALANKLNRQERFIQRNLKTLKENGYIKVTGRNIKRKIYPLKIEEDLGDYDNVLSSTIKEGDFMEAWIYGIIKSFSQQVGFCTVDYKYLAEITNKKERIIRININKLKAEGLIIAKYNKRLKKYYYEIALNVRSRIALNVRSHIASNVLESNVYKNYYFKKEIKEKAFEKYNPHINNNIHKNLMNTNTKINENNNNIYKKLMNTENNNNIHKKLMNTGIQTIINKKIYYPETEANNIYKTYYSEEEVDYNNNYNYSKRFIHTDTENNNINNRYNSGTKTETIINVYKKYNPHINTENTKINEKLMNTATRKEEKFPEKLFTDIKKRNNRQGSRGNTTKQGLEESNFPRRPLAPPVDIPPTYEDFLKPKKRKPEVTETKVKKAGYMDKKPFEYVREKLNHHFFTKKEKNKFTRDFYIYLGGVYLHLGKTRFFNNLTFNKDIFYNLFKEIFKNRKNPRRTTFNSDFSVYYDVSKNNNEYKGLGGENLYRKLNVEFKAKQRLKLHKVTEKEKLLEKIKEEELNRSSLKSQYERFHSGYNFFSDDTEKKEAPSWEETQGNMEEEAREEEETWEDEQMAQQLSDEGMSWEEIQEWRQEQRRERAKNKKRQKPS